MKLFEDSWSIKGKTYFREYDTNSKKSILRAVNYKDEYYIEDVLGKYESLLDSSVKLRKVQGSSWNIDNAYGETKSNYVAIRDEYFGTSNYNKEPGTFYLDIETSVATQPGSIGFPNSEEAREPIVLIQFFDTSSNQGYVLGLEDWVYKNDYLHVYNNYNINVNYIKCNSEKELILKYFDYFEKLNPYIIYAWNGNGFDYPYIFNRLKNLGIDTAYLSNYGTAKLNTKKLDNGQIINNIEATGHIYFDMMEIYKKFVFDTVPSYSLDYIGEKEVGIKKVNHDNYLKFDDFRTGKYTILGNETEEQKQKKIHKAAVALKTVTDKDKREKLEKYIKEKSYSDFVHYGAIDFIILKGIDQSRNFTSLITHMAEKMGCRLEDTLGTLRPWNSYISNIALKENKILPPKKDNGDPSIVGGFVRDPIKGKHKWVVSCDVSSMYPLLSMAAFNMSAETFVPVNKRPAEINEMINKYFYDQNEDKLLKYTKDVWDEVKILLKKYNLSLGINGAVYTKSFHGIIPRLVLDIYNSRKKKKQDMIEAEQQEINSASIEEKEKYKKLAQLLYTGQLTDKLSINSLYGALGQKYFSLFNESIASAITGNGRYFIKLLAKNIEETLQAYIPFNGEYLVAGDTDSVYLTVEPFVEKYCKNKSIEEKTDFVDSFYKKVIEKIVQQTIEEFANNLNAYAPEHIGADREIIADSALFVAKKKYVARVRDNEGKRYKINEPYLKVMGLEISQGGTATFTKKYLKEALPVILDKSESEIKDWFKDIKQKYLNEHLFDIAKTMGVSKLHDPDWGKVKNGRKVTIPFGSKACLVTNEYLIQKELQEQFPLLEPGNKVKLLYLQKPNPLNNADAFAFEDGKFAEIFKDYIDYDKSFEKFFQGPLENMVGVLDIDLNKHVEELDVW